ncbi:MAG: radical SAM protein [Coriobacteriales bacterium]|jgi:MoaA/NifB/PqqE/SkfB family radical SAM enzyme|nr:radical SAM protein [Coriobacteriales bacterium]
MSRVSELAYYASWFFRCKFLGRRRPLQSVIFITDRCNLSCRHCNVVREGPDCSTKTLAQVRDELLYCHESGSRFIDFEGGEPLLWRDSSPEARAATADGQPADINTLVRMAREIGFHSTTVTTNAQLPITVQSDLVWISIDGMRELHDDQRGAGSFERAMRNIDQCAHPNLNINMAVTSRNYQDFEAVAQLVKDHPKLRRFSFSFFVPYTSRDLLVPPAERSAVIDSALALKEAGYPLMNSLAGLRLLRDPQSFVNRRQCWVTNFIASDGSRSASCPGDAAGVCDDCGFGMGAEMTLLWSLHPSMVKAGLSVRSRT